MSNLNNMIGYVICESEITQNLQPVKIIEETEIDSINAYGEPIKKKRLIGEGVLQTADLENRNHRIYEEKELFPAIMSERLQTLISHGMLLGEMTHPLDATLARQQTIDEKLTSVRYLKIWTEGKHVWGRYKGTYTQYGQTFDDNLRDGYIPEFSLRALGSVQEAAGKIYVKNLKVITYDNVIYQSDFNAYHRKLVSEAANAGAIERPLSETPDIFEPIYNQQVIDYITKESANLKMIKESFDMLYESIKVVPEFNRVVMKDKLGNTFMINLEGYIQNEIMDYASKVW